MYVSRNDIAAIELDLLPQASMRVEFGHVQNRDTTTKLKASEEEKTVCVVILCFIILLRFLFV